MPCAAPTLMRWQASTLVVQLEQELWNMAYRTIDHGPARSKCSDAASMSRFSPDIRNFAATLVELQQRRHEADYDPGATFTGRR